MPYHFDVISDYEEDYGYCMATNRPLLSEEIAIQVPTRFLSKERVQDMFHIPFNYRKYRSNNKIQTDNNLVLTEIKAIAAAGIKRLTPHKLRHSFASLLLSRGARTKKVSQLLGHKDSIITLKTYEHFIDDNEGDVQELTSAILEN